MAYHDTTPTNTMDYTHPCQDGHGLLVRHTGSVAVPGLDVGLQGAGQALHQHELGLAALGFAGDRIHHTSP